MNFQLAKEIYGLSPWLVDAHSLPALSSILKDFRNGVQFESQEIKCNTPFIYDTKSEAQIIIDEYDSENNEVIEAIAVIQLNGPITKSGGASSLGMQQLSAIMTELNADERIKSFIILADSGGGSSAAVEIMVDTINEVKQEKPVVGLIEKGGMAASACYGILSACTEIYAEDKMSIVGSVGTMIQFDGYEANSKEPDGLKHVRVYATKSTSKNKAFEQALNEDKYDLLVNELLDPINENFINMVSRNRPIINSVNFQDGRTYFASEAIGTYIDGIKSFSEVVQIASSYKKKDSKKIKNNSFNSNNKKMTKAEFKSANPDAYAEIVAEGIALEQDRAGAWLAHVSTDADAVVEGINSGEAITQTQREAFFVKQNAKAQAISMVDDSVDDLVTGESKNLKDTKELAKERELENAFDFDLK